MSVGPFVVEFIIVFVATLFILHQYGNLRKQHILVSLAVFVAWFFSFLIVFILPLDVSNTCYLECLNTFPLPTATAAHPVNQTNLYAANQGHISRHHHEQCQEPWSSMPGYVLPDLWRVIYWSSQILSWLLLPIMQSYVYAGAFTVWGKIKTALFENAIWYGSYLVIFGGLLIYVALKPELDLDAESLKLIGMTASNTWGLLLLVLLLGYGLVELPRNAWNMSLPELRLEQVYFKLAKLSTEKEDAEEELADVLSEVKKASEEIRYNSNLRKLIDEVIKKCPEHSTEMFSKGTDDFIDYSSGNTGFTVKNLVKLHKTVIVVTHRAHRTQVQWNADLKLAFYLEDVEKNRHNTEKIFKESFSDHNRASLSKMRLLWLWEISLKPWLFKLLFVILLTLSVSLIWSEMTFFSTDPKLSIFALLIDVTKKDYLYFNIEIVSCITIAYMCACTYYTVFKIKVFNFYYFAPHHQTDANSLLFSGLLFCRLTYALCLNFLAMIHMDGHVTGRNRNQKIITETYFTKFMGHMDVLSFIAKGFNVYYPMIVLLVCFCTYFSLGKRALHCIGIQQFLTDDDFSADYVREGKEISKREKRKLEREIHGKDWSERSKTIQQKYQHFVRPKASINQRIDDDSGDDDMINPTTGSTNSKTKLTDQKMKYSKYGDKIQLLSDVEYAPPDSPKRSIRGYENISGTSRSTVPRNIFDDA